jgi:hypothetical protein
VLHELTGREAGQAPDPQQTAGQATAAHAENRARVVRARQRYEQVQKLKAEGKRIAAITRELRLAPGTGRRYFHAGSADELVAASLAGWPSMLDDYKPHLHQRWCLWGSRTRSPVLTWDSRRLVRIR